MAIPGMRSFEKIAQESLPDQYTSNALRLLIEGAGRQQDPHLLDVGPVCGENITFFAQRVRRLYVCDLFIRLNRDLQQGLPASHTLHHLDYPPQSFDGIMLWELADRLGDREVGTLAELCNAMIKPRGMVMVIASREHVVTTTVCAFITSNGYRFHPRPQPHLDLPLRARQNRDLLAILEPLKPFRSFIYRNGLREFLFKRA